MLPLPAGVASEAVDEDEGGFAEASAGGDVEMDGGLMVVEINGAGGEAAVEEVKGEREVFEEDEAEEAFQEWKEIQMGDGRKRKELKRRCKSQSHVM